MRVKKPDPSLQTTTPTKPEPRRSSSRRAAEEDPDDGSGSGDESGSGSDTSAFRIGNGVAHSPGEYRDGAITHISLKNFVTYDRMEVTPGPYMNMIIGPNGTGKSTLVCAIALGLGGRPSLLGRAKDISEF
ncbi:Structural maintenance of chromosomes protein 5, partial [Coemansia sp. RSA 2618]